MGSLVSTYDGPGGSSFRFLTLRSRAANRGAIGDAGPELKRRRAASATPRVKLNDPQLKLGVLLQASHSLEVGGIWDWPNGNMGVDKLQFAAANVATLDPHVPLL